MTGLSTGIEEAAEALFRRYAYPDWLGTHSRLVGRIALVLAGRCAGVDVRAVALAGYLHDIGRSPLLGGDERDHNELSALVVAAEGLGGCAELVRRHPVYAALDPATRPRTLEEKLVYYADRRGGLEILPLEERIGETAARHPRYADSIERSRPFARGVEREIGAATGLAPEDLAREVHALWP